MARARISEHEYLYANSELVSFSWLYTAGDPLTYGYLGLSAHAQPYAGNTIPEQAAQEQSS